MHLTVFNYHDALSGKGFRCGPIHNVSGSWKPNAYVINKSHYREETI